MYFAGNSRDAFFDIRMVRIMAKFIMHSIYYLPYFGQDSIPNRVIYITFDGNPHQTALFTTLLVDLLSKLLQKCVAYDTVAIF